LAIVEKGRLPGRSPAALLLSGYGRNGLAAPGGSDKVPGGTDKEPGGTDKER
jgi:hypothetical protein